ncbi:glycolate oxidase subunit GlcE [Oceanibacterium hippocampi]|uniref:Putative FAD-linked oxidoreductase n=1 Tax=Oceanibacterium hippocampi TaxID=745714 RepID=A0A1Y5S903_9PROT|nr:glycolate oxidase subunit GlcE [Oceanibacterium hippocampi]SLN35201.1 putative FAD-linked oxidoreductase [Oceanibacterium hippocampi]
MTATFQPDSPEQVVEAVTWALSSGTPLSVAGRGSKAAFGRPVAAAQGLSLAGLTGITLYEPEELVMQAGPGTGLAEIEAALAEKGQELAFEPADLGPLLGGPAAAGSIGGAVACNLAGPRRVKAGAARDHLLGFAAVSGRGELFHSGGRVVKNVTGYDLCKLLAGSFGTLGVMTTLTFKVLPRAEKTRTLLAYGLEAEAATALLCAAAGSPHEVSGLAHLPAAVAARSAVGRVADAGRPVTAIRIEGPGASVEYRLRALAALAGATAAETEELHSHNSRTLWREIRDVGLFGALGDRVVWRLSVAPTAGPATAAAVLAQLPGEAFLDWSGGLVWLALDGGDDAGAAVVRAALPGSGGHATLVRAPEAVRGRVPVFQPLAPALAALSARVKASFDPEGLLNPGRMYEGI